MIYFKNDDQFLNSLHQAYVKCNSNFSNKTNSVEANNQLSKIDGKVGAVETSVNQNYGFAKQTSGASSSTGVGKLVKASSSYASTLNKQQ